jgi:hypothetical protein
LRAIDVASSAMNRTPPSSPIRKVTDIRRSPSQSRRQ